MIIGQLEDSPGPSVVNAVEFIADIVKARFFEDGREFMLFDYWPKGAGLGLDQPEQYKLIELRPEGPRHHDPEWPQRWTREEMEELVGTELPSYLEGRYRADLGGQDQAG